MVPKVHLWWNSGISWVKHQISEGKGHEVVAYTDAVLTEECRVKVGN